MSKMPLKYGEVKVSEQARLEALDRYKIIDTLPEPEFDDIVRLASEICNAPISLISLLTEDRQWFKAAIGLEATETPREIAFCDIAIQHKDILEVPDATKDPRFSANPLVTGGHHLRFYAAAVLETPDGYPLGTLCVLDTKPRQLNDQQRSALKILARQVMTQLELRRLVREQDSTRRVYETVLFNTPDFVYVIDKDKRFRYANNALLTMWGRTAENSVGKNLLELGYEPWHAEMHEREIDEVFATKKSIKGDVPFHGTHGRRIYEYIFSPIFTENGSVEAIAGSTRDVTDRRKIEESLRFSEQRFRQLAQALPNQVWTSRPDGTLDWFNESVFEYSGMGFDDLADDKWAQIVHPDDARRIAPVWAESLRTGTAYETKFRVRRRDGVYRWHIVRALPNKNEDGEVLNWIGTNTDIEGQVQAAEASEAANVAKTEFLATMSHEIRTPMNAIMGLSNILAMSKPLTDKQRQFISTLQTSADSMLALINDLLDISKIEARSVELEQIPFSINRIMQEVASMMAVRVREKDLTFTAEDDCVKSRIFVGDPTRIRQIILNLCSNAIKFTDQGNVHVAVTTQPSNQPETEQITITVKDTGIGIAPEKMDKIFQKFVQADNSINRKYGGSGLGLTITKTLAEIMGGSITAESEPGRGSLFKVVIPLRLAEVQVSEADSSVDDVIEDAVDVSVKPRLLLVEDYEPNILVATTLLQLYGYEVEVATNGLTAFEMVKAGNYASVLMDVQMHGMNGLDATRLIRAYEKANTLPHLPIIGITAHALSGDRERCLGSGMDDYVAKPYNPDELNGKIRDLMNLKK